MMPTANSTIVLIHVDSSALARWVLWLAEALEKRPGTKVFLRLSQGEPGAEETSALAALLSLEAMLLRRRRLCGSDRIAPDAFGSRLSVEGDMAPDIVIDLTAVAASPSPKEGGQVLRPLYNGHRGETGLVSELFGAGTPLIEIERAAPESDCFVVTEGIASLEAASGLGGAMEAVGSRVITLIEKALTATATKKAPGSPSRSLRRIGRRDTLFHSAKIVAREAARAAYRLCCHPSHWRVGWRFVEPGQDVWSRRDLSGARWNVLADPVDHFYADPFPFSWEGRDFLFFEDLDYKTGKGIISVVGFDDGGQPGPAVPVLEESWHLSYPFLIEWAGQIWMIPESSTNHDIAIYRATDFPLKWERHAVLVDHVEAADATFTMHDGLFWMFAVIRNGIGGYSDTLAIWSADDLLGPWLPHAGNPILVDDRTARPAGKMVHLDGKLYRPVQDCRKAYGAAVNLMRVTRLDRDGFAQELEGSISSGPTWPGRRVHTLNYNGRLEAIDGFVPRPRLKPAADLVDSWFRPESS